MTTATPASSSRTDRPNAVAAFSNVLLAAGDRYLLLQRDPAKRFAPGKWTGIGGRIEPAELDDVRAAALRELAEEAGIESRQVAALALRRTLLHNRPGAPLTLLLYFTGRLPEPTAPLPDSDEGALHWVAADEISSLDVIDNTAQVLPLLLRDLERDPAGHEPVRVGAAHYRPDGELAGIVWVAPER
jgi:8-oxo-dGTP diphosphatase